jgi:xanthine dehydrogenase accessory factor
LIASRKKAPAIIERLKEELGSEVNLDNLYSPVGLMIGGATPDEIAISIIAELQAVRYGKEGNKHMRVDK